MRNAASGPVGTGNADRRMRGLGRPLTYSRVSDMVMNDLHAFQVGTINTSRPRPLKPAQSITNHQIRTLLLQELVYKAIELEELERNEVLAQHK